MFEVRQGGEAAVSSHPWRHSMHPEGATAPVYRFQAIDHDWEVGENHEGAGGVETRVSSVASRDVEARIQRLCSSLQSVLEKSRAKDRQKVRHRPVNAANLSTPRRYFPPPEEWGISEADLYLDSGGNLHGPLDVKHSS
uniref:DIOX_N domain-containing protein n=1 Tax=Mesocestoides corti TaxID=53468 RepID=A0A5K3F7B1_MESCO